MKIKNEKRELKVILDDYNDLLNDCKSNLPNDATEKINDLQKEALEFIEQDKRDKKREGIGLLLLFGLFISSFVFVYLGDKENNNLASDNLKKNEIINDYQKVIDNYKTLDSIRQNTDSLYRKILNIRTDSSGTTIIYTTRKGKILNYKDLQTENEKLEKENDTLNQRINSLETKLDLAQRVYKIHFEENENYITIKAEELDSALLLLPYFRNNVKYDEKKKLWIITHPSNKD